MVAEREETVRAVVLMPARLKRRIDELAREERRTLSPQIVYLLERAIAAHENAERRRAAGTASGAEQISR